MLLISVMCSVVMLLFFYLQLEVYVFLSLVVQYVNFTVTEKLGDTCNCCVC